MRSTRAILLWVALLFAFSPILLDLARHLIENPWARYTALFPLLFVRCALRESEKPAEHWDGVVWIAIALAVELLAVTAGNLRAGRVSVLIACFGLCRRFAFASTPTFVLLLFAIPIPTSALKLASPELPSALLDTAGTSLLQLGFEVDLLRGRALHAGQELAFERADSGVALAALLVGISWYGSLMARRPLPSAILRSAGAALLALPIQLAAFALALLALSILDQALVRSALTHLPWILVSIVGVAMAELRSRGIRKP